MAAVPNTDKLKNPGNLTDADTHGFKKFDTWDAGFRAQARQLLIDYRRHGLRSIRQIINNRKHGWANQWAPGNSAASVAGYISYLSEQMGISPDADVGFADPKRLAAFMWRQYQVESGHREAVTVVRHELAGEVYDVDKRRARIVPGAPHLHGRV